MWEKDIILALNLAYAVTTRVAWLACCNTRSCFPCNSFTMTHHQMEGMPDG